MKDCEGTVILGSDGIHTYIKSYQLLHILFDNSVYVRKKDGGAKYLEVVHNLIMGYILVGDLKYTQSIIVTLEVDKKGIFIASYFVAGSFCV